MKIFSLDNRSPGRNLNPKYQKILELTKIIIIIIIIIILVIIIIIIRLQMLFSGTLTYLDTKPFFLILFHNGTLSIIKILFAFIMNICICVFSLHVTVNVIALTEFLLLFE
jgi:hypothetical protein